MRPVCDCVRKWSAFVFFPREVSSLRGRKDEDGFLFCKRCVVRWPTLLMKRRALQSSTAHYFDGGSYCFSEAGAG